MSTRNVPCLAESAESTTSVSLMQDTLDRTNKTLTWLQAQYNSAERRDVWSKCNEVITEHPHTTSRFGTNLEPARGGSETFSKTSDGQSVQSQLGAKDAASLAGEETSEEWMEVTFAKPSEKSSRQCTSAGSSSEESSAKREDMVLQDRPGQYVVIHDSTFVSASPGLPTDEDVVEFIRAGTVVEVVEVLRNPDSKRVRGQISAPPGWISLLDLDSGYRWACRVEACVEHKVSNASQETSLVGAPTTPRATLFLSPASCDRVGTVCRKPRAKTMHRRNPQPKVE
mmetsp:Transcript_11688/g.22239  ORF Transcript_11688/g.22239 Transcript_11688/m.22239 type:complete len:284 (+) Transcript_11688:45-896(+)